MPPQFWVDFFVFSVVVNTGSTVEASEVLSMPQSTVSRKYRTFAQSNGLTVLGRSGDYRLPPDYSYFQTLLQAFFEYRRFSGQYSCILSLSEEVSGRANETTNDYSLYPGFVFFSKEILPWMEESRLFDFSLSVKKIPLKSEEQEYLSGLIRPFADLHMDEVGSYLRGFPFQFRELAQG